MSYDFNVEKLSNRSLPPLNELDQGARYTIILTSRIVLGGLPHAFAYYVSTNIAPASEKVFLSIGLNASLVAGLGAGPLFGSPPRPSQFW